MANSESESLEGKIKKKKEYKKSAPKTREIENKNHTFDKKNIKNILIHKS